MNRNVPVLACLPDEDRSARAVDPDLRLVGVLAGPLEERTRSGRGNSQRPQAPPKTRVPYRSLTRRLRLYVSGRRARIRSPGPVGAEGERGRWLREHQASSQRAQVETLLLGVGPQRSVGPDRLHDIDALVAVGVADWRPIGGEVIPIEVLSQLVLVQRMANPLVLWRCRRRLDRSTGDRYAATLSALVDNVDRASRHRTACGHARRALLAVPGAGFRTPGRRASTRQPRRSAWSLTGSPINSNWACSALRTSPSRSSA